MDQRPGALSRIDQDLRIMYTEYTLGPQTSPTSPPTSSGIATPSSAHWKRKIRRSSSALPNHFRRNALAFNMRWIGMPAAGLRVSRSGRSEEKDIQAVRESLDQYFHVASKTVDLLSQEWKAGTPGEATELRRKS